MSVSDCVSVIKCTCVTASVFRCKSVSVSVTMRVSMSVSMGVIAGVGVTARAVEKRNSSTHHINMSI